MIIELFDFNGFGKWVGQILLSVDLLKVDITSIHDFSDKVVAAQNMLGALLELRLLGLSYGSGAVTVQQNRTINRGCHSELTDELPQPHNFLRSIKCCDILYLISRVGYGVLPETFSEDSFIIQDKHVF